LALTGVPALPESLALLWAVVAAGLDVRQHRIPNWLTYSGMLTGLAVQLALFGWRGFFSGLTGGLFAGGIFLVFFVARAMGGGDVKLVTALGCFTGWPDTAYLLIAIALSGGVLALVHVVTRGRLWATVRNVGGVLKHHVTTGLRQHPEINLDNPRAARMPYGLAIAAGMAYWFTRVVFWR
jgi:prepilin peptidase CpaA